MRNHKDLLVWQKSMEHVVEVYKITKTFPKEEMFGIVSQMRRAAVSIPSNIAEGYGRAYGKETYKFLSNALGSATELETQWIISKDLAFVEVSIAAEMLGKITEIIRMLTALIKTLDVSKLNNNQLVNPSTRQPSINLSTCQLVYLLTKKKYGKKYFIHT